MVLGVDIYRALARRLYGADFPVSPAGIATGGTGGVALKDTVNLSYGSADANHLDGVYVLDETGYNHSRVTRGGWDFANSELDFADIETDFAAGDRYVLTRHHPHILRSAINDVLSNLYVPSFFPLSSHICTNDENDMETSPQITFFGNKSATVGLTENTSIVFNGAQSLRIHALAATQYTHPGTFSVSEGRPYYVSVMGYATQGDAAEFRVVNVQDSNATIENATGDEPNWTEYAFQYSPPSGCEQVQAWMISTGNGDITHWDDYVMVDTSQRVFHCPSWITSDSQIIDVVEFPRGSGAPTGDNDYRVWEQAARSVGWSPSEDTHAANQIDIEVSPFASRRYIHAKRPLSKIVDFSTAGMTTGGQSEAGSTTTLQDTDAAWRVNQWVGFTITCVSGTGGGQEATIFSNTSDTITIEGTWTDPDDDTVYTVGAQRTEPLPLDVIVEHVLFLINHPDRTEKYLAFLREQQLGGVVTQTPTRVGVR